MKYSEYFKMLEKKDHLINKLTTLSKEQKEEAIAFFTKHPNFENEIDWNRKDLTWDDFEEVMYRERVTNSQLKNFVKEGTHYLTLYKSKNVVAYQPLTWLGSRYLASKDVAPKVEGDWCIANHRNRDYWDKYSFYGDPENEDFADYVDDEYDEPSSFLILCTPTTKYALQIPIRSRIVVYWTSSDDYVSKKVFLDLIKPEVPNIEDFLYSLIKEAAFNHFMVDRNYEEDIQDSKKLEIAAVEARELMIKIFPKSFKKQVKKKGHYQWDGDITYQDLKDLGLVGNGGVVDERFKYFKITGNLRFQNSPITSIALPENLTSIKGNSFDYSDLTSITIPQGVTSIGVEAFAFCTSLKKVVIPDSVTTIGEAAFFGCSLLNDIEIPYSVTEIKKSAFRDCLSLTSVTIPDGINTIEDMTFYGCKNLRDIKIPNSVTSIKINAFYGCKSLESITIPDSVTSIGMDAFRLCKSLKSIIIPDSVTSIGKFIFRDCSSLEEITIPNSITEISYAAFEDCSSLESIIIPDSVTSIGRFAFCDCTSLKSITIPGSVTSIGDDAFSGCSSLKSVYIDKEKGSLDLSNANIPETTEVCWRGEF